jgi:hypothetical protein
MATVASCQAQKQLGIDTFCGPYDPNPLPYAPVMVPWMGPNGPEHGRPMYPQPTSPTVRGIADHVDQVLNAATAYAKQIQSLLNRGLVDPRCVAHIIDLLAQLWQQISALQQGDDALHACCDYYQQLVCGAVWNTTPDISIRGRDGGSVPVTLQNCGQVAKNCAITEQRISDIIKQINALLQDAAGCKGCPRNWGVVTTTDPQTGQIVRRCAPRVF